MTNAKQIKEMAVSLYVIGCEVEKTDAVLGGKLLHKSGELETLAELIADQESSR